MLNNLTGTVHDTVDYKNKMFKLLYKSIYSRGKNEQLLKDLEAYDLTHDDQLTLLGAKVQQLHLEIEVALALVTGVFLGVGRQVALVLAAASNPQFMNKFIGLQHARTFAELPFRSGDFCESDVLAAGAYLECLESEHEPWPEWEPKILRETFDSLTVLREHIQKLGVPQRDEKEWLGSVYPHVEFCVASGYRLNFAVHAEKGWWRTRDGGWKRVSNRTLVDKGKAKGVFFTKATGADGKFIQGLHAVSPVSPRRRR